MKDSRATSHKVLENRVPSTKTLPSGGITQSVVPNTYNLSVLKYNDVRSMLRSGWIIQVSMAWVIY
jgi:hypothetical protein